MRTSMLFMVVAVMTGCAVDAQPTPEMPPAVSIPARALDYERPDGAPLMHVPDRDICALAAELPAGDICALMCSPDAMKAQLHSEGEPAGQCLEFTCGLPDESHVIVGVCLPP